MLKTSKLFRNILLVSVCIFFITMISVVASYAAEIQKLEEAKVVQADNNAAQQEVIDENKLNEEKASEAIPLTKDDEYLKDMESANSAEQAASTEKGQAISYIKLNLSDKTAPLVCLHTWTNSEGNMSELISLQGVNQLNLKLEGVSVNDIMSQMDSIHIQVDIDATRTYHESFMFRFPSTNDNIDLYIQSVVYDNNKNIATINTGRYTNFEINIQPMPGQTPVSGIQIPYYNSNGELVDTVTTKSDGTATLSINNKSDAIGYFYYVDSDNNKSIFITIENYNNNVKQLKESAASITGIRDINYKLSDIMVDIRGNDNHSNFVLNIKESINDIVIDDIHYNMTNLLLPGILLEGEKINTNKSDVTVPVNIDNNGSLIINMNRETNESNIKKSGSLSITPVAQTGYIWENWNIQGKIFGPNSSFSLTKEDLQNVLTMRASYKVLDQQISNNTEQQASYEVAQTSDSTMYAIGVISMVAIMAGITVFARSRRQETR